MDVNVIGEARELQAPAVRKGGAGTHGPTRLFRVSGPLFPLAGLTLIPLLLPGCASTPGSGEGGQGAPLSERDRYELLQEFKAAADRIQSALDRMVAVNQSALQSTPAHPPKPADGPFARRIDFVWGGPLEPALSALAGVAGLPAPEINGRRPAVPVMVEVDAVGKTVADVLEDIGWKVGDRAWVHLDAAHGVISLGYPASPVTPGAIAGTDDLVLEEERAHGPRGSAGHPKSRAKAKGDQKP